MFLGINSDNWQIIGAVVAVILLIAGLVTFIVRSIFKLGRFTQKLSTLETDVTAIKTELQTTRKDLTDRIDSLINISIQKALSESNSPRQLNSEGTRVLNNSGMDTIVDEKFDAILEEVRSRNPENAYQAEQAVLDVVEDLMSDPVIKDAVENGAFQSGYPVPGVLFVGGLYVRDRVLQELGFVVSDIDQHTPQTN